MTNISHKFEDLEIIVKAGPGGDDGNAFGYVSSPLPKSIRSIYDSDYQRVSQIALQSAKKIANETGKNITLKYSVIFED